MSMVLGTKEQVILIHVSLFLGRPFLNLLNRLTMRRLAVRVPVPGLSSVT